MGRTMPSASQVINQAEQSFAKFRGALRKEDQRALDELFVFSHKHVAEIAYAANPLPFEMMMLSMLVEEHKVVMQLRERLDALEVSQVVNESLSV